MTKHTSVGAIIERNGTHLLLDRVNPPFGWAGPAGHVDKNESPEDAVVRETREEVGLTVTKHKLLFEEFLPWDVCSLGVEGHYWYLFLCEVKGEPKEKGEEAHAIRWYSVEEIQDLELEPAWEYWLEKLGVFGG